MTTSVPGLPCSTRRHRFTDLHTYIPIIMRQFMPSTSPIALVESLYVNEELAAGVTICTPVKPTRFVLIHV